MKLNILDYSPVDEGSTPREALMQTTQLAQAAEKAGYYRFWLSEHHEVPSVAGSNPEMMMMHVADHTTTIRVGSGGVMLPHYSAYKVAENFRILENCHPSRIDFGIGRSPSYPIVGRALNGGKKSTASYEQQIDDIYHYLVKPDPHHRYADLRATPLSETVPDIWLLGTSENSAKMAGARGMSYAYARFGAQADDEIAKTMQTYRDSFIPSQAHPRPQTMVSLFAVIGETTEEAEALAKTLQLWLLWIEGAGAKPQYMPAVETAQQVKLTADQQQVFDQNKKRMVIGTAEEVRDQLIELARHFTADELTIMPHYANFEKRRKGLEALMAAFS